MAFQLFTGIPCGSGVGWLGGGGQYDVNIYPLDDPRVCLSSVWRTSEKISKADVDSLALRMGGSHYETPPLRMDFIWARLGSCCLAVSQGSQGCPNFQARLPFLIPQSFHRAPLSSLNWGTRSGVEDPEPIGEVQPTHGFSNFLCCTVVNKHYCWSQLPCGFFVKWQRWPD